MKREEGGDPAKKFRNHTEPLNNGKRGEKYIFHCHQALRRFPNAVELG